MFVALEEPLLGESGCDADRSSWSAYTSQRRVFSVVQCLCNGAVWIVIERQCREGLNTLVLESGCGDSNLIM